MKRFLALITMLFPWRLRRWLLVTLLGYKIHPTAKIGFSWIYPDRLEMGPGSGIRHLTVCKGLHLLRLGVGSNVGNLNWITGFPIANKSFFRDEQGRQPELVIGDHGGITNRHLVDCTNSVHIGRFTTFGGFRSQILTHSIDLYRSCQSSKPVTIGDFCFVGTGCILLGGGTLPDYSVLAAGSVLNKSYSESHQVYAGNPAKPVKALADDLPYFHRTDGLVR
jgi:acetyltransferase-like isoleucine patch superfamily enzyme